MVPITVMGFRCERCQHEWVPRGEGDDGPKTCPKCRSPYWNEPRKNAAPMTYEAFRDAIRDALVKAGQPLTWTEVRMGAKLPQAFPNNQWVRRMEGDIALVRERDSHGILHWELAGKEATDGARASTSPSNRSPGRAVPKQGRLE